MANRLVKKIILGASLAAAGFLGYQLKQMRDFGEFFQSLKDRTAAQYTFQKDPTPKNKSKYDSLFKENLELRKKKGIYKVDEYLRKGNILYVQQEENNSIFAGKII